MAKIKKRKQLAVSSVREDKEQIESSCIAGGCAKWYIFSRKRFGSFLTKAKHIKTKPPCNLTPGYFTPEKLHEFIQKHVCYAKVDSSFIHNHQKLETIQVSFDGWMDKYTVVHSHNGILLNNQNE